LINSIRYILILFYKKEINRVRFLQTSLEEKSHKIKKLRTKIIKLEKGELC
jgi:hypothetical protein